MDSMRGRRRGNGVECGRRSKSRCMTMCWAKVKLNAKEEACLRDPYLAGTAEVIAGLVTTGPGGGLFATAMTSYRLFTCMF